MDHSNWICHVVPRSFIPQHLFQSSLSIVISCIHSLQMGWSTALHSIHRRVFMNAVRTRDEWYSIIQECRSSGLPDKVWCQEHGIPSSSFYYNIRQLRRQARDIPLSQSMRKPSPILQEVVPLHFSEELPEKCDSAPGFMYGTERTTPSICIKNGDITITCLSDVPASLVSSIIQTLRTKC